MGDPETFRDSTQIVLSTDDIDGLRDEIDERFTVTVFEEEDCVRIIGSPVVIKEVSDYLTRQGISLP